ncbi:hypothetical protein MESS4_60045 [Mesorhizobium sp. STM 4661]|nr:hypothetical protein MESS4_60045 [Mesorhizobium sp. STM 4661]
MVQSALLAPNSLASRSWRHKRGFGAPWCGRLQLMQQRVSLMAKRAALNQSLASAARQAVAQRDHPDALGWQWQVTAYMAMAGDRLCGEHAWP